MKKLLYIALLIVGYIYSQPGFPCYDIDIGNGLPNQNGEITGIQDCNLLCT